MKPNTTQFTRREFVKRTALAGAGVALLTELGIPSALAIGNSDQLRKWIQPLRGLGGPDGIPVLSSVPDPVFPNTDFYQVTIGEFTDQLHPDLGPTKLWGYWDTTPKTPLKRHLGGVIITRRGQACRIRFTNTLPATSLIPIDAGLPGANQAQNRVAIHLHGGFIPWLCDGGPFHWWAPSGASGLSFLNGPGSLFDNIKKLPMQPGQADYFYPNDQSCRLLWYHDHAHGITRTNAYAGLASGYLILDDINDAYIAAGKLPDLAYTLPLVFQDKKFVSQTTPVTDPTWATVARPDVQTPGSLWYEHIYDPKEFRLLKSNGLLPLPNPSCVPEFFGDTMLTNGLVYPVVTVEARRYRFLVLNACNARFLNLNLFEVASGADVVTDPKTGFAAATTKPGPALVQIGTECGFLVKEVQLPNGKPVNPATFTGNLVLGPGERADLIIDFTGMAGKEFIFYNDASGPFPAGPALNDYYLGNPKNPVQPLAGTGPDTRNVLRFKVLAASQADPQPAGPILDPAKIDPPLLVPYGTTTAPLPPLAAPAGMPVRNLTLNEAYDLFGRLLQLIGTTTPYTAPGRAASTGAATYGRDYLAPPTETPTASTTEVWRIYNLTPDTHPMHFHLVNAQVLARQPFKLVNGVFTTTGAARGPEANELGWKETVQMHPGEVTTVIMKFDLPKTPFAVPQSPRTGGNEYVWHCHILEHEEHDMMRPLVVSGVGPVDTSLAGVPYAESIPSDTGGTAAFTVLNAVGDYGVASSDPVNFPLTSVAGGFTVTVAPGLPAGTTADFTITDSKTPAAQKATVKVRMV